MERQINEGRHPGSVAPFGYRRALDRRLEPDPDTAPILREIFERVARGESLSRLQRDHAARGVRSQRGGPVTRRMLSEVLRNRVYLGEARSGERVRVDAHEALVDEKVWLAANSGTRPRPPRQGEGAILAGLVRCQGCRYVMAPVLRERRRRYRCLGVQNGRKCPAPAFVTEAELVPLVEATFFERIENIAAHATGEEGELAELYEKHDQAKRELIAFRDEPGIIEALGSKDFTDGLEVRRAAVDALESRIRRILKARAPDTPDAVTLRSQWQLMDNATRNRFLSDVFDGIVVRKHPSRSERLPIRDRVRFLLRGTLEDSEIPRSNRRVIDPLPPFEWLSRPAARWVTPR